MTILLCPLTNVIPLVRLLKLAPNIVVGFTNSVQIGAAQVAFVNPPTLKLDFTDAANIADCFLIEKTVRNTILGIISGMAVLPNRFLVKMDNNVDYFKVFYLSTMQSHVSWIPLIYNRPSTPTKVFSASQ